MKKICLLSITASHYRTRIYSVMQKQLGCHFIFGKDNTTVKRMDTSVLSESIDVQNKYFGNTNWYYQPSLLEKTKNCDVLINDLGIFCLSAWLLLLLAKARGQKVYNWDHGWYGRESLIKKILKRIYFGLADGAFIYGNYARDLMIKNGFNGNKLYVIHNSLDYDSQLPIRNSLQSSSIYQKHFGNNYPVVIFIGRLTAVKRLDLLISSIDKLKGNGVQCNLVIIGDGDFKEALQQQTLAEGTNNNVWFYGPCYDETRNAELIYNADVCVSPGNVGLTAIHTMMFGCPVITHDDLKWQMPEFEAIRKGITGDFFVRGNIESLASTISNWIISKGDKREEVRQSCYKEIDNNWNPHKQIEIFKKVIYG